jgi:hypothetical protein
MSDHELTHYQRSDGRLVPGCICGWYSSDGSHWRFERHLARYREARDDDDLAGYPKLCTTCGGTGHVTSYGGVHGDYDTQCSDCNGAGER